MRKYLSLTVLALVTIGILYFITLPDKVMNVNKDFERTYHGTVTIEKEFSFMAPYSIDVFSTYGNNLVFYSHKVKKIGLMNFSGEILRQLDFIPALPDGTVRSICGTGNGFSFIDLNGRSVMQSDHMLLKLTFKDSLPGNVMAATTNGNSGYILLRYDPAEKQTTLSEISISGASFINHFQFENTGDQGLSLFGNLVTTTNGESVFYIPMYNSRMIHYRFPTGQVSFIQTIDQTQVKDISISTGHGKMISSKAPVINRLATANDRWLFIVSRALAAADSGREVVDIYDTRNGKYIVSTQLPGRPSGKIRAISCTLSQLIISQNNHIYLYAIK